MHLLCVHTHLSNVRLASVYWCVLVVMFWTLVTAEQYQPNWKSLDSRPLPPWYDDAKFGIFITWGVYSVPSYAPEKLGEEWFLYYWRTKNKDFVNFMEKNYPPGFTYADFASQFTAELYDPNEWADILEASGAKYVVLITKHADGFTSYPSKESYNWNSMDVGPKRDLVGELGRAIRNRTDIHFGLYYCLYEWFNPLYVLDKKNHFKTKYFPVSKTIPELYEIVNAYKPDLIWSDGDWDAPVSYWNSTEFLAWLFNESPVKDTVVVNDRWGIGATCHHGSYHTCMDRYNPGKLQKYKWENAMTIDKASWGYRRNAQLSDYLDMNSLVRLLAETVSCGGNLLMNVGPSLDGRIVPIYEERLRQMGSWLKVNGEAIYETRPWKYQEDDLLPKNVWYTASKSLAATRPSVYAILLDWPTGDTLALGNITTTASTTVSMLGYPQPFKWVSKGSHGIVIQIPPIPINKIPCKWAWVFKFTNVL